MVPLDHSKLYLSMCNDSVTPNENKIIASDDEEEPKESESSSD